MGRTKKIEGGRVQGYYVQPHHERAVAEYARQHGHPSASAAVRSIFDQVAAVVGVALPAPAGLARVHAGKFAADAFPAKGGQE